MKTDVDAVIEVFGRNEQVKKVFWAVLTTVLGMVLVTIIDPVTAHQIIGTITGTSG
jgi:hypothetical protein